MSTPAPATAQVTIPVFTNEQDAMSNTNGVPTYSSSLA